MSAVKITSLETLVIELPRRTSYTWRSLQVPIGKYVVLKITTDGGIVGLGEAPAILSWGGEHGRYYGEDPDMVCYLINKIVGPMLTGAALSLRERVAQRHDRPGMIGIGKDRRGLRLDAPQAGAQRRDGEHQQRKPHGQAARKTKSTTRHDGRQASARLAGGASRQERLRDACWR